MSTTETPWPKPAAPSVASAAPHAQQPMLPGGPYGQPPRPAPTNGLAIASLVLGILWIWGLGSLLAVIFATVSKNQIRASRGHQGGSGLATAGLVLGIIGLAITVLFILFVAILAAGTRSSGY